MSDLHANTVDQIERIIGRLPTEGDRAKVRLLLLRRLKHPEMARCGVGLSAWPQESDVHPKSTGRIAAHTYGPTCCRCGNLRRTHDIDGLRPDCDGFVEDL
jgi:hypothetical protein